MRACACLLLLLVPTGFARAADAPVLDPAQPYRAEKSNPVTYEVDFRVVVTAPYHTKKLQVWLPMPQSDAGQEVEEGELSTFPATVKPRIGKEKVFGNRFAYFEFDRPEGGQSIRHTFKIKVWELNWQLDPERVLTVPTWPAAFDRYLRSEQMVVVDDRFRKAAAAIVARKQGPVQDLAAVMSWVSQHMTYDHAAGSLRADAVHALTDRKGHCSDYHGLCASVGRALGYPTRITYGINPFPKNSPSHCKLEVYLPPYGWVSFDVAETQRLLAAIQKDDQLDAERKAELTRLASERLRRGFRDNTWFVQTVGSDYDLEPPASRKVPLVRTIYAEADGVPLPDPDPADADRREFAWMTLHRYTPDRAVSYPFQDYQSLQPRR
jgi:transglutaminase-like putative cysteine protease